MTRRQTPPTDRPADHSDDLVAKWADPRPLREDAATS